MLPLTKDQWRASMSFGIIIMHIFRKNVASHFSEKISWDWCVLANIMPLYVWVLFHLWENDPILTANFVEIGPENDLANFVSVHLTEPCSVNMAEPQQTRRHQAPNHEPIPKVYRPMAYRPMAYRIFCTNPLSEPILLACRLLGTKPLPESILTYCQLYHWKQASVTFKAKPNDF